MLLSVAEQVAQATLPGALVRIAFKRNQRRCPKLADDRGNWRRSVGVLKQTVEHLAPVLSPRLR